MAVAVLCQLLWTLLLLCVTSGRPSAASQAEEVQKPFNLSVNSYNLNTTLHWDYNKMEMPTYFFVEILNKVELNWMIIEGCQNISHHYCDLSHEIIDHLNYYKVRVQALVGSKISSPETMEFSLSDLGIFGPPELDVYIKEKGIIIEIFHPELPQFDEIKSIMETNPLNYIVFCGNDTEKATNCDDEACTAKYPISGDGTYCFSAQGIADYFIGFTMEKSKETCIQVVQDNYTQTVGIIIGVIVGVLAIFAISCFIIARFVKSRALMPPSLSSFVRSIGTHFRTPMPKYDNVTTSPIVTPVDDKPFVEEKILIDTDVSTALVSKGSVDAGYQTENEQKTDEKGDDQSNSSSYFHTDGSSSSGMNSNDSPESVKDEKISAHEPETHKEVKPLPSSFGYDKPHFPKELA